MHLNVPRGEGVIPLPKACLDGMELQVLSGVITAKRKRETRMIEIMAERFQESVALRSPFIALIIERKLL